MLKKTGRRLRYIFHCTTLNDLQDDIENNRIDFNKYLVTIPAGTKMFRLVKGDDPIAPTGIGEGYPGCRDGHRWISSPPGFSPKEYRRMYYNNDSQLTVCGSGGEAFSLCRTTPFKEVRDSDDKNFYEITLKKEIQVIDLELICKSLRIPTPLSNERHPVYHKFYGTHIFGIKFRSFKTSYNFPSDLAEDNVFIYTDWFKEFKDIVAVEKIEKEPFLPTNPIIINDPFEKKD